MSKIRIAPDTDNKAFKCYGANADFFYSKEPEALLSGPYETGKTFTVLHKLHTLMSMFPGAQSLMLRKTYKSLIPSAYATYTNKVLPVKPGMERCPVKVFGGNKPEWVDYPNGSRMALGGLDNPEKVLSSEYDFIYIVQAEELNLNEYEVVQARATGRAGNAPWTQVMSDANPSGPKHFLINRDRLINYRSQHECNPMLFDQDTGEITPQGVKSMAALDALTGVRYKRGRLGLWVATEGQVYEDYNPDVHIVDPFPIPNDWKKFRVIDFGFRNPFVCQWWAVSPDDEMYMYREIYYSQRTVREHAEQINRLSGDEVYTATATDHDASDRATLDENGIVSIPAKKDIKQGIEVVQERFKIDSRGKSGIYYFRDCTVERDPLLLEKHLPTSTVDELPEYAYTGTNKKNRNLDELPIGINDHGCDTTRYAVMYLDEPRGKASYITIPNLYGRR